jgi:gas vesicle protein
LSFSFISLVILGALVALLLAFSRAKEIRSERGKSLFRSPSPSHQSSP